jgi:multidrug efflux pump subunit AcrA (membrane-fusion protein)
MNKAKEAALRQDVDTKRAALDYANALIKDLQAEIGKCKLYAPQDGTAVYYVPEQTRTGIQAPVLAVGEPVREGQKLMRVPDLTKPQMVIRVPEALVSHVRQGVPAVVKIDAYPDQTFRGSVSSVDPSPSARDWLTADEKVYPTVITIEGNVAGLKPGMSGQVIITPGRAQVETLAVPLTAIIGRPVAGRSASCLVMTADGPQEREVVVGMANEKLVGITSGLKEGEEVIVNPRLLLNDIRDRIRFLRSGTAQPRRQE